MKRKPAYLDLGGPNGLPENKRIALIAAKVAEGQLVAVLVDDDSIDQGKADRYIKKVQNRCKRAVVLARVAGPVDGVITIKFGLPEHQS